ncbi:MAG: SRPBCC family protein, partial [Pseudomonadota bacterium]
VNIKDWVKYMLPPQGKPGHTEDEMGQIMSYDGSVWDYEWEGNKKVGHGRMTIAESTAPSRVVIQLDFFVPFEAHNMGDLTLQAQSNGTLVTWAMYGPSPFISKLFSVFVSMDKMIGKDFEDSLANLKRVTENN